MSDGVMAWLVGLHELFRAALSRFPDKEMNDREVLHSKLTILPHIRVVWAQDCDSSLRWECRIACRMATGSLPLCFAVALLVWGVISVRSTNKCGSAHQPLVLCPNAAELARLCI